MYGPLIVLLVVAALGFIIMRSYKKKQKAKAALQQLKVTHPQEGLFLCDSAEGVKENMVQLYGEAWQTAIRPGMRLRFPNGATYPVAEVYADDKTPDRPNEEIPAGSINTAIVVTAEHFDWDDFGRRLSDTGALGLVVE